MNVRDDMYIELVSGSVKLTFNFYKENLIIWKRFEGAMNSFSADIDKVWRYDEREWK